MEASRPIGRRDAAQVEIGEDGWLFLVGGSNDVRALYRHGPENLERARRWAKLISTRSSRLQRKNIRYVHLGAPEKLSIYGDKIGVDSSSAPLGLLAANLASALLRSNFVDPTSTFRAHRDKYLLYWKTDSHWTPWGCFAAYQMLCSKLDVPQRKDLLARPFVEGDIFLDLAQKIAGGRKERARFYQFTKDAVRVEANALVLFKEANGLLNELGLHVGSRTVFQNNSPQAYPATVVLFGDSFSEYRTHLLTGLLAETFRELHFLWSADIDYGYVDRVAPDVVVTELAERFLSRVPTDTASCEEMAEQRLAEFRLNSTNEHLRLSGR